MPRAERAWQPAPLTPCSHGLRGHAGELRVNVGGDVREVGLETLDPLPELVRAAIEDVRDGIERGLEPPSGR